jgi:hypothetical protein
MLNAVKIKKKVLTKESDLGDTNWSTQGCPGGGGSRTGVVKALWYKTEGCGFETR